MNRFQTLALSTLVGFAFLFQPVALADWKQQLFERRQSMTWDVPSLESHFFEQIIDHSNPEHSRTFNQRYYIDSTYAASPASPVLFYLCGEATCKPTALRGAIRTHAEANKAHMIALEHRYYGQSLPFPVLSTQNLKFLSTDSALKDAERFQTFAQTELGLTGKWVVIGGSYPGNLAAYYRNRYSDRVVGALSSSAPVRAKENFEEYDQHVTKVAGPACAEKMRQVSRDAEAALPDPEKLLALKQLFQAEALIDNDDFLYLIADMGALAVQYGYRDHFCTLLDQENPTLGHAEFTKEIFRDWQMTALSTSAQGAINETPSEEESGMRQWFYQSCTEYGYWQNAFHDETQSVRSKRINAQYHNHLCERLFGITTPVDTDKFNHQFLEPLLKDTASSILFTNGSTDPWSVLSLLPGAVSNPNLSFYQIEGAAHCDDLRAPKASDSEALKRSRTIFAEHLSRWLKS